MVVNRGSDSLSLLANDGNGGFTNPEAARTTPIGGQPGPVVAGDFNRDGKPDLAVLVEGRGEVWIYTNQGDGTFTHTSSIPVGSLATGLSVVPGGGPGLLDLLVGNQYGDIRHLVGRGDGTFHLAGRHTSLSVQPNLFGPEQPGVLVGNQAADSITVQPPTGFAQAKAVATLPDGTPLPAFAPGSVQWAQLDGGNPYAMVAESGSNQVMDSFAAAVTAGGDAARRAGPAPTQPAASPGDTPPPLLIAVADAPGRPAKPLPPPRAPAWEKSLLAALTAGGLALWTERRTSRRTPDPGTRPWY